MSLVKEIDVQTLLQWQGAQRPLRLIDVRSVAEIAQGTIEGAQSLPLHLLPLHAQRLELELHKKGETIVFVCRSGARSYQACGYLMQRGRANVVNLQGGVIAWVRAGQDLVLPLPEGWAARAG